MYRIDLGQTLGTSTSSLRFAYAADLVAPVGVAGEAHSVTVVGDYLWFSVNGDGVYRQLDTFVSDGWVQTGRIRLGVMENKSWRDLRVIGENGFEGAITAHASILGSGSPSLWDVATLVNSETTDASGKLNSAAPTPAPDLYLAFNLQSNVAQTGSSRLIGYQLRAVPSPRRNELIQVPVRMFDFEKDRQGASYGRPNGAYDRFKALKSLEANGGTISFIDHMTGENLEVYIESVSWRKVTAPSRGDRKNAGGIVTMLLRSV